MSAEWKQPCWNVIAEPAGPFTCVLTWCFPCVTYGINVSKLGDAKAEVMCSGGFTPACCLYCCITSVGCPCVVHIPTRKYIRKKYGVKEPELGILEDVLMTWCCSCCSIIQDYNEIAAGEGATTGTIFSDMHTATETAPTDVEKCAKPAQDAVDAVVEKIEDAHGSEPCNEEMEAKTAIKENSQEKAS